MMSENKILSRRDLIKLGGLAVGAAALGRAAERVTAKETAGVENLVGQMDEHGNVWVSQKGGAQAVELGKGRLFREVTFDVPEGKLGHAHGDEGEEVDGFRKYPDPAHPGAWLYFVELPETLAPGIEPEIEG